MRLKGQRGPVGENIPLVKTSRLWEHPLVKTSRLWENTVYGQNVISDTFPLPIRGVNAVLPKRVF